MVLAVQLVASSQQVESCGGVKPDYRLVVGQDELRVKLGKMFHSFRGKPENLRRKP